MDFFVRLCPDTLADILFRIPEAELIRAKCVSKSWHDFISNVCVPRISKNARICGVHFRRVAREWESSPGKPLSLASSFEEWMQAVMDVAINIDLHTMGFVAFTSGEEVGEKYRKGVIGRQTDDSYADLMPSHHKNGAKYFMGSCNGLLLLADEPLSFQYYVCNPTTRQCVTLPKELPRGSAGNTFQLSFAPSLAFDPSVSTDYKVIQFGYIESEPAQVGIDIFSSSSGTWFRHLRCINMPFEKFRFSKQSVFWNGVLYKLSLFRQIVMVDLEGLNMDIFDAPESAETDGVTGCIGLSMGRLCYSKNRAEALKFWEFHENQWILKHSVDTQRLIIPIASLGGTVWRQRWISPCAIHPDEDAVFVGTATMLLCYHFGTKMFRGLYKAHDSEFLSGMFHPVHPYYRCLVTLKPMRSGGSIQLPRSA